jgi:hypothetical protein
MSFLANIMKDWLSVKIGMGVKTRRKSFPSLINHIPSAVANDPAINSDSIEDLDTLVCFFDAQESGESLYVNIQPVVDFRLFTSLAKSASVNPARL